jgi:PAS domain S-box-containing protein
VQGCFGNGTYVHGLNVHVLGQYTVIVALVCIVMDYEESLNPILGGDEAFNDDGKLDFDFGEEGDYLLDDVVKTIDKTWSDAQKKNVPLKKKKVHTLAPGELQEKRRRRNITEKLRTKKLNEEFANLAQLFSLPNQKKNSLSKIETIKTAQAVIKDLTRKLKEAQRKVQMNDQSELEKKTSIENDGGTESTAEKNGESAISTQVRNSYVFQTTNMPMSLLDISGVIKHANPSFLKVTGFSKEDIEQGKVGMFSMSSKEDLAQMYLNAGKLISGHKQYVYFQKECRIPNDEHCMFHISMSTLRTNIKATDNAMSCSNGSQSQGLQYFHCTVLPKDQCL